MENLTHSFREMNLVLTVYFVQKQFFQDLWFNSVYSVLKALRNFAENIHNFTYQKTLLHTLLLLVSKIIEILQCILKHSI